MRVQNPRLQATEGKKPRWWIRPYVDHLNPETGRVEPKQIRIYLGLCAEVPKKKAIVERNRVMAKLNRRQYVVQAQIPFGAFLDIFEREHVQSPGKLAAGTQTKYLSHIKNHIRPAFGQLPMGEITTLRIDAFLAEKAKAGLSWSTRLDIRNILCGIFTQADRWGYWKEKNPALSATVGRRRECYGRKKLTIEETRSLLAALPHDVSLICQVALFCALRISEVLGLQWRHVDFDRGLLMIRQRYYRGDVDETKTSKGCRDMALGHLVDDLKRIRPIPVDPDGWVFSVRTHIGDWKKSGVCRDDRDIHQHFLRPAAKALNLYYLGFGFRCLRREAITALAADLGPLQTARAVGHGKADMSLHYTLSDSEAQAKAVRKWQEKVRVN